MELRDSINALVWNRVIRMRLAFFVLLVLSVFSPSTSVNCGPGLYRVNTPSLCKQCDPGKYQPNYMFLGWSCFSCKKGYYTDKYKTINCYACSSGTYSSKDGQSACVKKKKTRD